MFIVYCFVSSQLYHYLTLINNNKLLILKKSSQLLKSIKLIITINNSYINIYDDIINDYLLICNNIKLELIEMKSVIEFIQVSYSSVCLSVGLSRWLSGCQFIWILKNENIKFSYIKIKFETVFHA